MRQFINMYDARIKRNKENKDNKIFDKPDYKDIKLPFPENFEDQQNICETIGYLLSELDEGTFKMPSKIEGYTIEGDGSLSSNPNYLLIVNNIQKFVTILGNIPLDKNWSKNYKQQTDVFYKIINRQRTDRSGVYRPTGRGFGPNESSLIAAVSSSKSNIQATSDINTNARGASGLRSSNLQAVNPENLTPDSLESRLNKQFETLSMTGLELPTRSELTVKIESRSNIAQALISKINGMGLESQEQNNWIKSIIRYIQFTVLQDIYNHFKDYYDNQQYKDGIVDFITVFLKNNPLTVDDYRILHPQISNTPKLTSWGKLKPDVVIYDNEIPRLFRIDINSINRSNLKGLSVTQKRSLYAITVKITYDDSGNAISCPPGTIIPRENDTAQETPCNDNWAIPDQKFSPVKDKLMKEKPEMTHLIGEYRSIQKHGDTFKKSVTLLGKNTRGFFGLGGRKTRRQRRTKQRKHKVKGQKKTHKPRRKKTQKRRSKE
jgi:hypothetical protein